MADIFDEINDDLRAERARALLRRYGIVLAVAVVLAAGGVVGWQYWKSRQASHGAAYAGQFLDAMRKATPAVAGLELSDTARGQALDEFGALAKDGPEGYRTLARLRAASLNIGAGQRDAALAELDRVSADTAADPLLRGLADLLWVQAQLDAGEPAAVEGRLAGLLVPGGAWRAMAQEQQALLMLRTGREAQAKDIWKALVTDQLAPGGVRSRAAIMLARSGEAVPGMQAPGAAG